MEGSRLYNEKRLKGNYVHTEIVHNLNSPREVVPLIMNLFYPKSVLDVGCGLGTWLRVFEEGGVIDYLGVDGEYVDKRLLKIPEEKFLAVDLQKQWSVNRKFDLVICLEVAEHLREESADLLVESLVSHGDTIVFSAAIPGQGGQYHINEQWPRYWQEKFAKHGFYYHDELRPLIWENSRVDWWYRQNIFTISREKSPDNALLMDAVHPELFRLVNDNASASMASLVEGKQGLRLATTIFLKSIAFKLKSITGND
jgi:SAM-dependent methyltransferase